VHEARASAEIDDSALLAALGDRDEAAFQLVVERHRRELLVHCYRMLGSFDDAEDMLQETLLRAWGGLSSFEGRSALRPWLYKIATNVCLDALASRRRRLLPTNFLPHAEAGDPMPRPIEDQVWIEPIPDALIDLRPAHNPEASYDAAESVSLAFLATLQTLPGRQRAVLVLRDVLGFGAAETADLLATSVAAVNSALQRARGAMKAFRSDTTTSPAPEAESEETVSLLTRYVEAWEAPDAARLVALLREDVVFTMPPLPLWYQGRTAIRWFLEEHLFTADAQGRFRLVATRANGCPAFGVYQRDDTGAYRPAALHLLTVAGGQIAAIHDFLGAGVDSFARFGLPLAL
jgi:RNA polymerase sigma-70 factor (ECF subfamily)